MLNEKNFYSRLTKNGFLALIAMTTLLRVSVSRASAPACQDLHRAKTYAQLEHPELSQSTLFSIKYGALSSYAHELNQKMKIDFRSMFFNEEMSTLYKGEFKQSLFMKEVLKSLFPNALFSDKNGPHHPGYTPVTLRLADVGEAGAYESRTPLFVKKGMLIPMHLAKAANSELRKVSRNKVRHELGLPPKRKVISLYVRSEDTMTNHRGLYGKFDSKFRLLLDGIKKAFPLDIVVLTFGNHTKTASLDSSGILYSGVEWAKVVKLSDLEKTSLNGVKGPILVVNDSYGKMKSIHASANMAVVVGPINFFEPLSVGTPTLLIQKTGAESDNSNFATYDKDVYRELINLAEQTGYARSVEYDRFNKNWADPIEGQIHQLMAINYPPTDVSSFALPRFLMAIEKAIRYELESFDPKDFEGSTLRP